LQPRDIEKIFDGIYRIFSVSDNPEITIEANPDDLSLSYVASLKSFPINRISIGIQSFDDKDLRMLNRRHTAVEAESAVLRCKEAGLANISIDLIYGLPGQTADAWSYNVDKAVDLDVQHISAYSLSYEEGTAIYKMLERKEITPVDDDSYECFFRILTGKLASAGFVHYEISNFAKRSASYPDGRISLHNSSYWNGTHYLGIGPSAHSYSGNTRCMNVSSIAEYIKAVNDGGGCFYETEWLDERTRYNDFIITRLRTMWGVSLKDLRDEFGEERERYFLEQSEPYFGLDMLNVDGGYVKVSCRGIFVSDAIMCDLIAL
jgi:oxygen-independent coproporphyrinogen-3 oxidase